MTSPADPLITAKFEHGAKKVSVDLTVFGCTFKSKPKPVAVDLQVLDPILNLELSLVFSSSSPLNQFELSVKRYLSHH